MALVILAMGSLPATAAVIGDERVVTAPLTRDQAAAMPIEQLVARGRALFSAKFSSLDGAGRPAATGAIVPTVAEPGVLPRFFRTAGADSNACRGCHNDPVAGGAGEFVANAFVSEGFQDADFDTVDAQFSNERGTPALHGSGLVELLAREMTGELRAQRLDGAQQARRSGQPVTIPLKAKGVSFGSLTIAPDGFVDFSELEGIDQDLIVRPFSQKGVFTSLRQFTVNALNAHHGMQATERFGPRYTDSEDFDKDGVVREMSEGDVTALVAFQATLPPPKASSGDGLALLKDLGCATCHIPTLPLDSTRFSEPNPFNPAGNLRGAETEPVIIDLVTAGLERDAEGRVLVALFSDLKRHRIADDERPHYANELLSQRFVSRDVFLTARLWGVGSTAPYGHRGDLTTLHEAIIHHGAEATDSRRAYEALGEQDRRRVIGYLQSLRLGGGLP
ncbi:di-heme oxidoredictase family protein [Magnetospira sp. QH-2]|uniref:di-heme oxidoredictase family protein n=1 Tax=Magnetospira sp. (strain QH-2) TaxID=1288970 RepID=UPI0003E81509|nr:di-heme oxidoredictase family protein [Magnetospira sp. QH-2]CCQ75107.1 conserved exported protein of unknown function [Magnetospira sp. QH-2]